MTGFPVKPLELVDVPWHNAVGAYRIADTNWGGTTAVTFSSISQNFKHLLLIWKASTSGTGTDTLLLRVNTVSTANYRDQLLQSTGVASAAAETLLATSAKIGFLPGSTGRTDAHYGSGGVILFPGYSLTGSFPTWVSRGNFNLVNAAGGQRMYLFGGALQSAAQAISAISITSLLAVNTIAGARATLYGMT